MGYKVLGVTDHTCTLLQRTSMVVQWWRVYLLIQWGPLDSRGHRPADPTLGDLKPHPWNSQALIFLKNDNLDKEKPIMLQHCIH